MAKATWTTNTLGDPSIEATSMDLLAEQRRRTQSNDALTQAALDRQREVAEALLADRERGRQHELTRYGTFDQTSGLKRDLLGTHQDRAAAEMALQRMLDQGKTGRSEIEWGGRENIAGLEQSGKTERARIEGDTTLGVAELNPALITARSSAADADALRPSKVTEAETAAELTKIRAAKEQAQIQGDIQRMAALDRMEQNLLSQFDDLSDPNFRGQFAAIADVRGGTVEDPKDALVARAEELLADPRATPEQRVAARRVIDRESGITPDLAQASEQQARRATPEMEAADAASLKADLESFMAQDASINPMKDDPDPMKRFDLKERVTRQLMNRAQVIGPDRAKDELRTMIRGVFDDTFGAGDINDWAAQSTRQLLEDLAAELGIELY